MNNFLKKLIIETISMIFLIFLIIIFFVFLILFENMTGVAPIWICLAIIISYFVKNHIKEKRKL
jgi:uncharacterized protein (DUF983 family)